jgi:hypothetical protein
VKQESRPDVTALEGEELNAVSFVMDYVEFHFNGPRLQALSNPVFQSAEGRVQFPAAGARDALCSLIGSTVQKVEARDKEAIRLHFTDERVLVVPLDDENRIGPEAATFHTGRSNSPLIVW